MYVKESKEEERLYLSLVAKQKNNEGETKVIYISKIGYVDKLQEGIPEPKQFFSDFVKKIEKFEDEKPNEPIPLGQGDEVINLGCLYIKWVLKFLGVNTFFKKKQKGLAISYNLSDIFCTLLYSQILFPSSIEKAYNNSARFIDKFNCPLYDIYRSLDFFAEYCEDLQEWIYKRIIIYQGDKLLILPYDGSNVFFETDKEDAPILNEKGEIVSPGLRSKGFSKENRPLPISNIGTLSFEDGIVAAFNIFPGKGHEKTHLLPLLDNFRDNFDPGDFELIADRGLYSSKVIAKIEGVDQTRDDPSEYYIIGMPSRSGSKEFKEWASNPNTYDYFLYRCSKEDEVKLFKYKSRVIEKQLKYINSAGKNEKAQVKQKQIAYYSRKYARKEAYKREEKLKKATEMVNTPSKFDAIKSTGAGAYIEESAFNSKTGEKADGRNLNIRNKKIKEQEKMDGIYTIVTNNFKEMPWKIHKLYKTLLVDEQNFKILKSYLKIRPVYLKVPNHILAHVLICIIALDVLRVLEKVLDNKYTILEIIESLRDFSAVKISGKEYIIPRTNEIIEKLKNLSGVGFENKYVNFGEIQKKFKWTSFKKKLELVP